MIVFTLFRQNIQIHFRIFKQQFLLQRNLYLFIRIFFYFFFVEQIQIINALKLIAIQRSMIFCGFQCPSKSLILIKLLSHVTFFHKVWKRSLQWSLNRFYFSLFLFLRRRFVLVNDNIRRDFFLLKILG